MSSQFISSAIDTSNSRVTFPTIVQMDLRLWEYFTTHGPPPQCLQNDFWAINLPSPNVTSPIIVQLRFSVCNYVTPQFTTTPVPSKCIFSAIDNPKPNFRIPTVVKMHLRLPYYGPCVSDVGSQPSCARGNSNPRTGAALSVYFGTLTVLCPEASAVGVVVSVEQT